MDSQTAGYDPYNPRKPTVKVSLDGGPMKEVPADLMGGMVKEHLEKKLGKKASVPKGAQRAAAKQATAAKKPERTPMFDEKETGESTAQTIAAGQLRAFIERVERLEEEKQALADDIRDVYGEIKGVGFDVRAVRTIVKLRKKDQAERQEEEAILDLYKAALGMC